MDDIRPPRSSTNYQSTSQRPSYGSSGTQPQQTAGQPIADTSTMPAETHDESPVSHQPEYALPQAKQSKKGLIITLVVFIVLFLGSAAFAAWEYMQIQDLNQQITELKDQQNKLEQQVYSLNYDNKDLTQKLDMAQGDIDSLEETKQLLYDTCGSACADILH